MWRDIQTKPSVEPISILEAKNWGLIEYEDWDPEVYAAVIAARQHVENVTGRAIIRQKWRIYYDAFQSVHKLEPHDVREVEAVYYLDADGIEQTLATSVYTVDLPQQRLFKAYDQTWPTTRAVPNAVYIDVWSGFYDIASPIDLLGAVPEDIKLAMKLLITDVLEHRMSTSEMQLYENRAFMDLLAPYRKVRV